MGAANTTKRSIRVLVADLEAIFRIGLKKVLGVEDDLRVVAQADKAPQLPGLAKKFKPDLLFVQAEMLGRDPRDSIFRIRQAWAPARIIITASALAAEETARYVEAGAVGVILKSVNPALFVKSARRVMRNELWLPEQHSAHVAGPLKGVPAAPLRPADTLTRREKSIIACLVQGWRNREIALRLRLTEQTVKNYLRTIYDKVGVSDRLELVLYAIHQRMELPPIPQAEP
jgi:two-component system nitrate/nitrite response regulator NarL